MRVVQIEPGPMPTLIAVRSGPRQVAGAIEGRYVAGNQIHFRQLRFHSLDRFEHQRGVAMGAVNGQHIHFACASSCARSRKSPVAPIAAPTRSRPVRIFGGVGILQFLLNVLDRDQALEDVLVIHDQQLFHAVLVQNLFRFLQRGAHGHGDQVVLGHDLADRNIEAGLKAQIAIGENADQFAVLA